jgi:hypothetical protein
MFTPLVTDIQCQAWQSMSPKIRNWWALRGWRDEWNERYDAKVVETLIPGLGTDKNNRMISDERQDREKN